VAAPSIDNSVVGESLSTKYVLTILKETEKPKKPLFAKEQLFTKKLSKPNSNQFYIFYPLLPKTWIEKIWSTYTDCF
jgi:hypothetical protein